jgi:amino acid transporter
MHIPVMFARLKLTDKLKTVISAALCVVAGIGLFLFIKNGVPDYLFFRVPFAFLDYEKAGALVFLENILMLSFWAFIGTEVAILCRNSQIKTEEKKNPLFPVVFIMGAIILGLVINMISGGTNKDGEIERILSSVTV